ncbi:unnamed protein product [Periconia digitata]|uniref:Uncharacterized protein n=1 Tax=Periconia digitata TaxID=1303443 RepID=A0A9W4UF53_9PLEO|nr:unnamed protein product [Periconia digitata]
MPVLVMARKRGSSRLPTFEHPLHSTIPTSLSPTVLGFHLPSNHHLISILDATTYSKPPLHKLHTTISVNKYDDI